ncbi:hypothetical protein HSB1_25590 [Halogranum salarium B-1]|uniref:Uncharacterized protein n=1 Tax=Halogranum salarium B-1 TaxID=1210908 RepID=J3A1E7_9EURY|nr:hypothetical protein HSB1_25590 [Halogranum salarium B-1]
MSPIDTCSARLGSVGRRRARDQVTLTSAETQVPPVPTHAR